MADRNVPATDTIEDLRATYNGTGTDIGDISKSECYLYRNSDRCY